MIMTYTFYCYSKCSTCAKARKQLIAQGVDFQEIDLKETPPTSETIKSWMGQDYPIKKFFNTSGMKYRELGLKDKVSDFNEEEASQLLSTDGMLIKRPILLDASGNILEIGYKSDDYAKYQ
jgi:Spx/MgsR family transcriptional regulator